MNKKNNILVYAIILGLLLYIMDSFIFWMEFIDKYTFIQALLTNVPFWEILSRLLVLTIIIIIGMLLNEKSKEMVSENHFSQTKNLQAQRGQPDFNFLSSLSFQIKTPLNAIIGFSELLKIPNLPPESRDTYISYINSSSKYLLLLINNVTEISKIESNKLIITRTECDLSEILEEIYVAFHTRKNELGKPDISLFIDAADQYKDFSILTDPERLKQVFHNLLENSLNNTEEGVIKISYKIQTDGYIEFSIADPGRVFSQEKLESIFERYNKLTDNNNMPFDGLVLRMAISKSQVKLLGGDIRASSIEGQGTTIFFTIPYLKVGPKPEGNKVLLKKVASSSINWSDRIILISEDVDSNYVYLSELLKPTKISILWAKNGIEAVEYVVKNPKINLVLMDILMPEMDGYEAAKKIKNIRKDLPIIAQTAYAFEGNESSEQNINFDTYLTKPIWEPQLMAAIKKYI